MIYIPLFQVCVFNFIVIVCILSVNICIKFIYNALKLIKYNPFYYMKNEMKNI